MIHFSTDPCVVMIAGGLLLSKTTGVCPASVRKNCVGWTSLNCKVRVTDIGQLSSPPNRCWLALVVDIGRRPSRVEAKVFLFNRILKMGRVGSQSPWGPVLMLFV